MMKIIIDGKKIKNKKKLHKILKEKLQLPEYYGMNLDALEECLLEIVEKTKIQIINTHVLKENLGKYGNNFLELLEDLSGENENIKISIK